MIRESIQLIFEIQLSEIQFLMTLKMRFKYRKYRNAIQIHEIRIMHILILRLCIIYVNYYYFGSSRYYLLN
jgi:hypothetical protein